MLVLTRKVGEQIKIGDDIVIRVVELGKGSVRLGIEAPAQVSILRHEVYERIQKENVRSSQGRSSSVSKAALMLREKGLKE